MRIWNDNLSTLWAVVALVLLLMPVEVRAEAATPALPTIEVVNDSQGSVLKVDGEEFMVLGMNWDYFPIGTNYAFSLWAQPEEYIKAALDRDIPVVKAMGVNAIRLYNGIPPKWVQYIYEQWGIFTVLNHPMARYGYTLDGIWIPNTDYSDPKLRDAVKAEILALVEEFESTPGILMWLLGNENNYGLSWSSFEIEALPEGEQHRARAQYLYSLYGEITRAIKEIDTNRPVAIANGDLQYIDLIAEHCQGLDILGSNVYRGISARDFFQEIQDKLGIPALFTEFGADAWNAKEMREDQENQCKFLVGQWQEIYEQSYGKGRVGNAIGGLTFQWVDGWWKYRQEINLDVHDTNASWPNGGYPYDYVEGDNNMNEEWWGICAKGPNDAAGLYSVYPRAAYYGLQQAYRLDPYGPDTDLEKIREHFGAIEAVAAGIQARGVRASLLTESLDNVRVKSLRMEFETYNTGGSLISTPEDPGGTGTYPAYQGFDKMQSFYAEVEATPSDAVRGTVAINVLGDVPTNPIDEIFYENRGRPLDVPGLADPLRDHERVAVHTASITWDDRWFRLDGFYRTGHTHWGYDGDFFGLYRDAFYGENIDIYNGKAPVGVEITGKRAFNGWVFAFGPELWWGANPSFLLKNTRKIGPFTTTGIFQEDLTEQLNVATTFAIPTPPTRTASLHMATTRGNFALDVGGIWSGNTKVGDTFVIAQPDGSGGYNPVQDEIVDSDTFGAKAKLQFQKGRWNWYAQAARMGLVANGGPTQALTFTGWELRDSGSGNQTNFITGLAVNHGNFQVSPNFLWQKPLIGPNPTEAPDPATPRNILDDPFAVRANRETRGLELLITYDQTPATWMWHWDSIIREDAKLAASLAIVHRHQPTTMDASLSFLEDGSTLFAFGGAAPAQDVWETRLRVISKLNHNARLVSHVYGGTAQANGDSQRLIKRFGADARLAYHSIAVEAAAKFNDFGPYDYHRDFAITFPMQLMGDISYSLGKPRWFGFPQTKMGVRATYRTLDAHHPRYCPGEILDPGGSGSLVCDPDAPGDDGTEWEVRTYLHLAM